MATGRDATAIRRPEVLLALASLVLGAVGVVYAHLQYASSSQPVVVNVPPPIVQGRTDAEVAQAIERARRETLEKAIADEVAARISASAPLPSVPKSTLAKPGFVAEGWTAAGVYSDGIWSSKLLSFSAASKPEDLPGLVVTPTRFPGNYLRADPPRFAGDRGKEIGELDVGVQLQIGDVRTVPSTTAGISVWVAVRRIAR